jgi:hypothetical protein
MRGRALTIFLGGALLVTSACSATVRSATDNVGATETSAVESSLATSDMPATTDTVIVNEAPATSLPVATLPETAIAPTTTEPGPQIYDPACVVVVEALDSLGLIANAFDDETVNVVALRAENNLPTADIEVGQLLDVCTGNGLDDITGEQRTDPDEAVVAAAVRQNVEIQQLKLNKLFEEIGTPHRWRFGARHTPAALRRASRHGARNQYDRYGFRQCGRANLARCGQTPHALHVGTQPTEVDPD